MTTDSSNNRLYYSIREVAERFGLNESTLRYWEKEFDSIAPRKRPNGVRYYRTDDIEAIRIVYHLLKERGMTLAGAKRLLKGNRKAVVDGIEITDRLTSVRNQLAELAETLKSLAQHLK